MCRRSIRSVAVLTALCVDWTSGEDQGVPLRLIVSENYSNKKPPISHLRRKMATSIFTELACGVKERLQSMGEWWRSRMAANC